MTVKYVFAFEEGSKEQKFLLGGKGANLAEMTNLGLPVPPGFTITTEACNAYMAARRPAARRPDGRGRGGPRARSRRRWASTLGDAADPLLVSVRSGAPFSMPGMMDTVLNLGLNDDSVQRPREADRATSASPTTRTGASCRCSARSCSTSPATSSRRRCTSCVEQKGFSVDTELSADDLAGTRRDVQGDRASTKPASTSPTIRSEQLRYAIEAVFKSWNGKRARDYRKMEGIADDLGTAVNVQTMVFGNKGDDSGTGVAFTRNPSTGENLPYGDFLKNAQGEDVVAGIRITEPLDAMGNDFPEPHKQLLGVMKLLENHYRDMCDIEFTIEQGRLFMLQTRVGKRTAAAALRMAVEMEDEGLIDEREAVLRVQPAQLDQLLHPQFDPKAEYTVLAKGLNASPGAAVGKVYFTADDAEARHEAGERVILVRPETSPDDLHGMIAAEGILTSRGGLVSHAAVVARGMGTPAICGAEAREDRPRARKHVRRRRHDRARRRRDLDLRARPARSSSARSPVITPEPTGHFGTILGWADGFRRLKVRTNADLPEDAQARARVRRRGHRPLPHRAHVPRRPAADRAAHDPRRHDADEERRARASSRAQQEATSSASSRRWTGCRSPCGCSTRRCTSSCPTTRS